MLFPLVLAAVLSLGLAAEVCYPPCGCHNDQAPFDDRPLPENIEDIQLAYTLYTLENPTTGVTIRWDNIPSQFKASRRTVFMIHGWNSNVGTFDGTRKAFIDANYDYNIIHVDWKAGASRLFYPQAASNTRVVGACTSYLVSQMIARGLSMGNVYCVGHSLGAHTCGYMGRDANGDIGRITGLDPAGPFFSGTPAEVRLDQTDARFIDNMHTNVGAAGIGDSIGHVDFFPNNGLAQPPCEGTAKGSIACDHGIGKNYLEASIREKFDCQFQGRPCASEEDADEGLCDACGDGCGRMGFFADTVIGRGRQYLRTQKEYPYCEN